MHVAWARPEAEMASRHSCWSDLRALTGTRRCGDDFAGAVEPRGGAVWWNRAGSRLRAFALVRQLAPLDRQIPHRLVIDTPKASSLIGSVFHETGIGQP